VTVAGGGGDLDVPAADVVPDGVLPIDGDFPGSVLKQALILLRAGAETRA